MLERTGPVPSEERVASPDAPERPDRDRIAAVRDPPRAKRRVRMKRRRESEGGVKDVEIFVAVLCCSRQVSVEAVPAQSVHGPPSGVRVVRRGFDGALEHRPAEGVRALAG